MKILVISLAGIGDTLFATPLIHELRSNFPSAEIDALVLWPGARDVLGNNSYLNSVYQKNLIKAGVAGSLPFLIELRKKNYDISINTHPQSRIHYRMVARVINARTRVSHAYDNSTPLDHLLINRMMPQDYWKHSIENNLQLLELIEAKRTLPRHDYELYLSPKENSWAEEFIAANRLTGRALVGIHVGSGGTKNLALRRWPLASYMELIRRFTKNAPEVAVLLFGGPEEEADHKQILGQADRSVVFLPTTRNIREAAALLKHCQSFLSVDTALMHVAAAVKVPGQVVIETPTWNKTIEPHNNPFKLVANPAVAGRNLDYYRYNGRGISGSDEEITRCMTSVSVDAVYQALVPALNAPKL